MFEINVFLMHIANEVGGVYVKLCDFLTRSTL